MYIHARARAHTLSRTHTHTYPRSHTHAHMLVYTKPCTHPHSTCSATLYPVDKTHRWVTSLRWVTTANLKRNKNLIKRNNKQRSVICRFSGDSALKSFVPGNHRFWVPAWNDRRAINLERIFDSRMCICTYVYMCQCIYSHVHIRMYVHIYIFPSPCTKLLLVQTPLFVAR